MSQNITLIYCTIRKILQFSTPYIFWDTQYIGVKELCPVLMSTLGEIPYMQSKPTNSQSTYSCLFPFSYLHFSYLRCNSVYIHITNRIRFKFQVPNITNKMNLPVDNVAVIFERVDLLHGVVFLPVPLALMLGVAVVMFWALEFGK